MEGATHLIYANRTCQRYTKKILINQCGRELIKCCPDIYIRFATWCKGLGLPL